MSELDLEKVERALVIVAHPDDAEFGSAGTVAAWTARGIRVDYVICTDGAQGSKDPTVPASELKGIREKEQREAAAVLGVSEVTFLGHPDGSLVPDLTLRRDLTREIRRSRPDVVICQNAVRHYGNLGGNHPDHLAAGQAAIEAIYPFARNPYAFPELLQDGLEPHVVSEVLVTGTPDPDYFVDISTTLDRKLTALRCHRSQHSQDPAERVTARLREQGQAHGLEYAESFRRVSSW
ncbi:MAG: PIG-L deacetylase family protein [Candidatus Dormibacteria bacterium]|jgi:LmbE family N-acetylglucosaminyl deacetylase